MIRRFDQSYSTEVDHDQAEDNNRQPEEIRAEIRRTKAQMESTVQAIQRRLTAEEISRRAALAIREKASSTGHKIVDAVKRNPVPFAIGGVTLGLLIWRRAYKAKRKRELYRMAHRYGRRRTDHALPDFEYDNDDETHSVRKAAGRAKKKSGRGWTSRIFRKRKSNMTTPHDYQSGYSSSSSQTGATSGTSGGGGRLSDVTHRTRESARQLGSKVSERMHDVGEYARDTASNISHKVQYGTRRAREWTSDTYEDYPLAVGAAAFAVGLTCGLLIPVTRKEQELMGPAASKVINQARQAGSQLIDKGKDAAQRAVDVVKSAAGENNKDQA